MPTDASRCSRRAVPDPELSSRFFPLKTRHLIPLTVFLLGLCACEPKERAVWSPDGRSAAVVIGHELHFADERGRLTGPPTGDADRLLVEKVAWSGDGSSLVVHRIRLAPRWEELRHLLPTAEAERVEAVAARMPELLRSAVVLHGDMDRIDQLLSRIAGGESELLRNALHLALAANRPAVADALSDAPKAWRSLAGKGEEGGTAGFFLHELALVRRGEEGGWEIAETFGHSLRGVVAMRLSPVFPVLAVSRVDRSGGEKGHDLEWIHLDGTARGTIATGISSAFSWMPDGRGLVMLVPVGPGQGPLMRVLRRDLLDAEGRPLAEETGVPRSRELALAIQPFAPRLAVLPGGEVLFASQPGSLPMRGGKTVRQPRLYLVPGAGGEIREVPTEEGALPMDLGYFVLSPDGRRLAVVESGSDAVAVIDLASGASELVSGPHPGWKCRSLPSWKSSDELSFAALDPATDTARWVLWKEGDKKLISLSADWPTGSTAGWLEYKKESETPAITP